MCIQHQMKPGHGSKIDRGRSRFDENVGKMAVRLTVILTAVIITEAKGMKGICSRGISRVILFPAGDGGRTGPMEEPQTGTARR